MINENQLKLVIYDFFPSGHPSQLFFGNIDEKDNDNAEEE